MDQNLYKDKVRPVQCDLCGAQMYYRNQDGYEPEVEVTSRDLNVDAYMHQRCIENARRLQRLANLFGKLIYVFKNHRWSDY